MSLHFILGRRGAGKTQALYREIFRRAAGDTPLYLVVPEQATFLHERGIEEARGERSLWHLQVTSFRRLAQKQLLAQPLDHLGQQLQLYKVMRQHRDQFTSFRLKDVSGGFIENAQAVLNEAYGNLLEPSALREKAAALTERGEGADLSAKLRDIALLMEQTLAAAEPWLTEDQLLLRFEEEIRQKQLFEGAVFLFDDFFDFTAVEYRVIDALLCTGAEVWVSLLWAVEEPLLAKTEIARQTLTTLAQGIKAPIETGELPPYEEGEPSLRHLERHYGSNFLQRFQNATDAIQLWLGEDIPTTVHLMAQNICALRDEGIDLSEIALVFRDIEPYWEQIREIFPQYGIEYYLDQSLPLHHTALFAYCGHFLRLVRERWSYDAVFALVKSGLSPLTDEESDRFENYCLAHAIKGRRFYQEADWTYEDVEEDLSQINQIRRRLRDFILPLEKRLLSAKRMTDYATVIWDFLVASDVVKPLAYWRDEEQRAGRLLKAAELEMALERMSALLDQLALAFPDDELSFDDFYDLFTMGLHSQRMRTIPPALHELEISLLGQSRPARKRVVIIGGVNEGNLPASFDGGGFLNAQDRAVLGGEDGFWPQNKDFFYANEDMLTYQALTLATERLILMAHEHNQEGAQENLSVIIYRLQQLFPNLQPIWVAAHSRSEALFWAPPCVLTALPQALREEGEESGWHEVSPYFVGTAYEERCRRALSALSYTGSSRPLRDRGTDKLYLNASALDTYLRCPFSYFAKYDLRLRERRELVFKAPDLGTLFHEALRLLLERMAEQGIPWRELAGCGDALIAGIVLELLPKFGEGNLFSEEQQDFWSRRLTENLQFVIGLMASRLERGDQFEPLRWEASFGPDQEMAALTFSLRQGEVVVTGQIDRIDVAKSEGTSFYRIIDYKSGNRDLKLADLYLGLKVQLLLYLVALENDLNQRGDGNLQAGGIFFLPLRDFLVATKETLAEEELAAKKVKDSAMHGYVIGDERVQGLYGDNGESKSLNQSECDFLVRHLQETLQRVAGEIFDGVNAISPYLYGNQRSCQYCPYGALCGYEPSLHGAERRLPNHGDRQLRSLIAKEVRGNDDDTDGTTAGGGR